MLNGVRTIRCSRVPGVDLAEVSYTDGVQMPRHAHDETSITLLITGGVRESSSRAEADVAAWSVGLKPAGVEHADRFSDRETRTLCVKLDRSWQAQLELDRHAPAVRHWRWVVGGAAAQQLVRMLGSLRDGVEPSDWLENAAIDLVAALHGDPRLAAWVPAPPWLARARAHCTDEALRGVRTSRLAADAGVHPVSLARAFRRHFGESISDVVRRSRAQAAVRLLASPRHGLADVAAAVGCADQSHLTRLLRAETGRTPKQIRALAGCDRSRTATPRSVRSLA